MNLERRLTWLIQLTVLTLFAWVIAGIITTVTGYFLYSVPTPMERTFHHDSQRKGRQLTRNDYNIIAERDLLKVSRTSPSAGQGTIDKDVVRPIAAMGLALKGTIAGPKEIARAIIESNKEQKIYKIGDEIMGATLLAVFRNKVIVDVNGQEQMLVIEEGEQKAGAPAPGAATPSRFPGRAAAAGPQGMNPLMKNLDQFLGKARVVPYFKGGEPYGFRVSNLGSDAKAYGLGVRAGDIIRSVNGVPVRTPEDAFKAYQDFQNESNVQLELERNGQSVTVNVPLKQ
ncbi:MAG TPA: type II secretion system protein N [Deltaproteobacteria bacterium]|jgi:general secretion pathway protein C|nr:type II secretion system protein N [Deltaproteobacteria bacterium]